MKEVTDEIDFFDVRVFKEEFGLKAWEFDGSIYFTVHGFVSRVPKPVVEDAIKAFPEHRISNLEYDIVTDGDKYYVADENAILNDESLTIVRDATVKELEICLKAKPIKIGSVGISVQKAYLKDLQAF